MSLKCNMVKLVAKYGDAYKMRLVFPDNNPKLIFSAPVHSDGCGWTPYDKTIEELFNRLQTMRKMSKRSHTNYDITIRKVLKSTL